jgi:hypothetical protein
MDSSLPLRRQTLVTLASLVALAGVALVCGPASAAQTPLPNILLIVVDDIGIDQWKLFGYGGTTPAATPNIDAIAAAGIKFHNLWAMPACSNGRAALFTGRYPLRTHVYTALGNNDLANFMVNPSEVTAPNLLRQRGYKARCLASSTWESRATIRTATEWCGRSALTTSTDGWTPPAIRRRSIKRQAACPRPEPGHAASSAMQTMAARTAALATAATILAQ